MSLQDNKNIINQVKSGYMCENKRRNPFFCECIVFFAQNPLFHFNTICTFAVKWYAVHSRLKNFQIAIKLERHKLPRIDPACHSFISIYNTGHNFCFKLLAWNLSNFYDFQFSTFCIFVEASNFDFGCGPRQRKRANAASSSYSEARKCSCYFRPLLNLDHPRHHHHRHNKQWFIIMIMVYSHLSLLGSKLEARKYSCRS